MAREIRAFQLEGASVLICGIDFETTGLDSEKNFITEVGAVVFNGETWEIVREVNHVVHEPEALPLPKEIVKLTGITDDLIRSEGIPLKQALESILEVSKDCVGYLAHNAPFDEGFLGAGLNRAGIDTPKKPFYCSKGDVKEHEGKRCTKLSHLALDYGVTVDGSKLHRALDDVRLMGEMLKAAGTTITKIKAYAEDPWVYIEALCKGPWVDGGKSTNEAKSLGFAWERCSGTYSPVFSKKWVKRVKKSCFEEELKKPAESFKRVTVQTPA